MSEAQWQLARHTRLCVLEQLREISTLLHSQSDNDELSQGLIEYGIEEKIQI